MEHEKTVRPRECRWPQLLRRRSAAIDGGESSGDCDAPVTVMALDAGAAAAMSVSERYCSCLAEESRFNIIA